MTEVPLALPGYRIVTADTALDTVSSKQLVVRCPRRTVALGAGWAPLDSTDAFVPGKATAFEPSFDGRSWLINAQIATPGTEWKLRARLLCAAPPAGYGVVVAETAVSLDPWKQLVPACAAGQTALGAGWAVLDGTSAFLSGEATHFMAAFDATSWLVNARSDAPGVPWKLRSRALCATTAALPTFEVVTTTSATDTLSRKQVVSACPATKMAISDGWGALDPTDAIYQASAIHSLATFDATGWIDTVDVTGGVSWKLRTRTLCL